jgi:hypothetical protein
VSAVVADYRIGALIVFVSDPNIAFTRVDLLLPSQKWSSKNSRQSAGEITILLAANFVGKLSPNIRLDATEQAERLRSERIFKQELAWAGVVNGVKLILTEWNFSAPVARSCFAAYTHVSVCELCEADTEGVVFIDLPATFRAHTAHHRKIGIDVDIDCSRRRNCRR